METLLRSTYSLCPICQIKLPAAYVQRGQEVLLEKTCPVHGFFSAVVWGFQIPGQDWINHEAPLAEMPPLSGCLPACARSIAKILAVWSWKSLSAAIWTVVFALPTAVKVAMYRSINWNKLRTLASQGKSLVQLSGGEPTLRDDLPQIIVAAKRAGLSYVQLNTNGLRLAEDPAYAQELAAAGLSFVFLQFDGLTPRTYQILRGQELFALKERAIAHCDQANLGVTLVVTLVPQVNTDQIGDILRYAWQNSPTVRGVNLQPVGYFGRIPGVGADAPRLTLDRLAMEIELQTQGVVQAKQLFPAKNDHPLCGFHGDFVIDASGQPRALSRPAQGCSCKPGLVSAVNKREFLARRWQRKEALEDTTGNTSIDLFDLDYFARRVQSHGFTITAIAFQDAGNLDLERLQRCRLHVYDQGRMVPFCAFYYTPWRSGDESTV